MFTLRAFLIIIKKQNKEKITACAHIKDAGVKKR